MSPIPSMTFIELAQTQAAEQQRAHQENMLKYEQLEAAITTAAQVSGAMQANLVMSLFCSAFSGK